ncbi:cytidine deaminase [Patescibacteria group bacterium]|nr:cytidine deaminase [Patescibacteria group bacterium]MCG2695001.1 deaminase [Candidatus Parcubacteria bacterium]
MNKKQTITTKRIDWDTLFMLHVRAYAMRSACVNYKVGAVFTKDNRVLTGGFNGPPRKEPNCCEVGCAKRDAGGKIMPAGSGLCRGAHAEMNSLANACIGGVGLSGVTVYCSFSPCWDCAKHLVNLGISRFVYEVEYTEEEGQRALDLLKRRGVELVHFTFDESVLLDFQNFNPVAKEKSK